MRQQELLYNVEFQLQQMERKVARAGGVRSEEETRVLNARIEKLTQVLEGVNAEHGMLLEQVKHSEEDLMKARRCMGCGGGKGDGKAWGGLVLTGGGGGPGELGDDLGGRRA